MQPSIDSEHRSAERNEIIIEKVSHDWSRDLQESGTWSGSSAVRRIVGPKRRILFCFSHVECVVVCSMPQRRGDEAVICIEAAIAAIPDHNDATCCRSLLLVTFVLR